MTRMHRTVRRALFSAAAASCLSLPAFAQGHPGGGPGGPGGAPGGGFGGMNGGLGGMGRGGINGPRMAPPISSENNSTLRGGLQLGPPGRWWDDKGFAKSIGLDNRQQKRMDEVFGGNRDVLLKLQKSLQHEESQLEKLTRSRELDENQIFQQIDRVTQARGELEKAYAHMLLQIRKEMTPEQASRLDESRPAPPVQ